MEAKRLSVYMGHSDIRVTYNVYGHLMPGSLDQDADRLSTFLDERVDELRVQNLGGSDRAIDRSTPSESWWLVGDAG